MSDFNRLVTGETFTKSELVAALAGVKDDELIFVRSDSSPMCGIIAVSRNIIKTGDVYHALTIRLYSKPKEEVKK